MKLVIITAIEAFENDIKAILKKSDVKTYSYREVTGYKDFSETAVAVNWFAAAINETESILFYAFVEKEKVDQVFLLINEFNAVQESLSDIHLAVLNIEKSNNP